MMIANDILRQTVVLKSNQNRAFFLFPDGNKKNAADGKIRPGRKIIAELNRFLLTQKSRSHIPDSSIKSCSYDRLFFFSSCRQTK
jgi:hypothetical protein